MYLVPLKTLLVQSLIETFDAAYPVPEYRNLSVTLEYPLDQASYPGIWVDWEGGDLTNAGIGHIEVTDGPREVMRWRFAGTATFTLVALSQLERDGLYDEMVKVFAFGTLYHATNVFRSYISDNEYLGLQFNWDKISTRGESSIPGTPWETDDVIYEVTLAMDVVGEFVSPADEATMLPLSAIVTYPYNPLIEPVPGGSDGWG